MAKGILPKDHPLNYFTFGFNKQDEGLALIEEADLLLVVGFDTVEKLPKDWNKKIRPILHIDPLPVEMDEHYPVKGELVGDLTETFQALNKLDIASKPWDPMGNLKEQIMTAYQMNQKGNLSLTTENILTVIKNLIISNGLASMGIALPGAIGAKLACSDAPVICITGDGGALMNISELETAKRLGLSFIINVLNNSTLKLEEQMMQEKFDHSFGTSFENPDFVQLAESFGIKAVRPNLLNEFEQVLRDALYQNNELLLIDDKDQGL